MVFGGPTFWSAESAAEVLAVYREFLPQAPHDLNGFFCFHHVPPAPPMPRGAPPAKGVRHRVVRPRWREASAEAMAPLLDAVPEPLLHGVQATPHAALQSAFDGVYPRGDQWYSAGGLH